MPTEPLWNSRGVGVEVGRAGSSVMRTVRGVMEGVGVTAASRKYAWRLAQSDTQTKAMAPVNAVITIHPRSETPPFFLMQNVPPAPPRYRQYTPSPVLCQLSSVSSQLSISSALLKGIPRCTVSRTFSGRSLTGISSCARSA